jgi:two-component system, NtrC family, sensor histidine kinase HydH
MMKTGSFPQPGSGPTPGSGPPADEATIEDMVSVIAHEVRNPLAAIKSALQVVERRIPHGAEQRVLADVIERVDALDALVDELLLFSETPTLRPCPLPLEPLVDQVVRTLSARLDTRCRVTVTAPLPLVNGDAALLRTVFLNLLTNAAHASGARGSTQITLSPAAAGVVVAISDEGPGFAEGAGAAEFRPFFTTKARGTGLGLPTARRLVQLHGGDITIDSRPTGTRVNVTLPAAR